MIFCEDRLLAVFKSYQSRPSLCTHIFYMIVVNVNFKPTTRTQKRNVK